jgi:hypothetical protein
MRRMGDNYLGIEHVLLGILRSEDGTAVRMLGAWAYRLRCWRSVSSSCVAELPDSKPVGPMLAYDPWCWSGCKNPVGVRVSGPLVAWVVRMLVWRSEKSVVEP